MTAQKCAVEVQVYLGLFFAVRRHLCKGEGGLGSMMNALTSCVDLLETRSGLSEKVAAISKRKTNLLNMHIQTNTATSVTLQTQPPYPENSPPFTVSMSSTNEPTRRMTTRGGARDKIAKVMERVRSGGIAKGNPNQPEDDNTSTTKKANKVKATKPSARKKVGATKAASMAKKPRTTKKIDLTAAKEADVAAKKALAAKLAQLEDKFLKKADISRLSHPRQWKGKVQGSTAPL